MAGVKRGYCLFQKSQLVKSSLMAEAMYVGSLDEVFTVRLTGLSSNIEGHGRVGQTYSARSGMSRGRYENSGRVTTEGQAMSSSPRAVESGY